MSLKFRCAIKTCKKPILTPGGLMFGPPDENDKTEKFHICAKCFERLKNTVLKKKYE